ncbi:metal-dependent hydrolase [Deinococcus yavapaiensis]|uniref:UPF0173 metal-dependent hydrolase DES52_12735 n=1 Tax=Deinococcus yavapaiensis KR-236 TaxID=694435 RepID=A0A318SC73_9DEIO|nr:metal-dependent hydrolase [Deinococcus yavapaiensis]PYE48701.1 L-ascorbate metabolism protein UlaG (beta-lactamase superfamily) [Deinococcus yavapaiensis KR-236]
MEIRFLGHSAFLFSTGEHKIVIDPFIQGNPTCPVPLEDLLRENVSAVLLTHAHGDHLGNALDFARAGATIIATAEIGYWAQGEGVNAIAANIGGTVRLAWGSVKLTPAWHSSSFPDGRYGGMPTGMIVEMDGVRIYHAGDTNAFGDMALIGEEGLDLAILPIGDHFTMGPREAARALEWLKPKRTVPMHYGTFPPLTGDPQEFARLARERGVEPYVLNPGETLQM